MALPQPDRMSGVAPAHVRHKPEQTLSYLPAGSFSTTRILVRRTSILTRSNPGLNYRAEWSICLNTILARSTGRVQPFRLAGLLPSDLHSDFRVAPDSGNSPIE